MTRRSAEVRLDALLRTACDVIVERGLANTRTADVATAAGVSQALVFYHFATKERLLAQAFAYAAEQDLARLDAVHRLRRVAAGEARKILKLYAPTGSLQVLGDVDRLLGRVDARAGAGEGLPPPGPALEGRAHRGHRGRASPTARSRATTRAARRGASSRSIDGLAVQVTVHERVISRRQLADWVREHAARELGLEPDDLA